MAVNDEGLNCVANLQIPHSFDIAWTNLIRVQGEGKTSDGDSLSPRLSDVILRIVGIFNMSAIVLQHRGNSDSQTDGSTTTEGRRLSHCRMGEKVTVFINSVNTIFTERYRLVRFQFLNSANLPVSDVMFKLLAFTAAMVMLPLGTYWFTLNYIFQGMFSAFLLAIDS